MSKKGTPNNMLWRKDSTHKYIRIKCINTIIIDNSSYHTKCHYVT